MLTFLQQERNRWIEELPGALVGIEKRVRLIESERVFTRWYLDLEFAVFLFEIWRALMRNNELVIEPRKAKGMAHTLRCFLGAERVGDDGILLCFDSNFQRYVCFQQDFKSCAGIYKTSGVAISIDKNASWVFMCYRKWPLANLKLVIGIHDGLAFDINIPGRNNGHTRA